MKAHIGVDADSGLVHKRSFGTTMKPKRSFWRVCKNWRLRIPTLEQRVIRLEKAATHVTLDAMTGDELLAYAARFPMFSRQMYAVVLTLVQRRQSTLPVVHDAPDYALQKYRRQGDLGHGA